MIIIISATVRSLARSQLGEKCKSRDLRRLGACDFYSNYPRFHSRRRYRQSSLSHDIAVLTFIFTVLTRVGW